MPAWLRDPLTVFLLAGTGLFFVADLFSAPDIPYTIDINDNDLQRLSDQWQMQMRRPPSAAELSGLLEQFIREEIYFREAQRLGLDDNDTIVRRRMVQKLTFLTEDIATAAPLEADQLRDFYNAHQDDYRTPERTSFKHRYFSVDRRNTAYEDAQAALTDTSLSGDPFMLQREYAQRSDREIRDLFGTEFAAALAALEPADAWQGPLRSAYGWHVVWITERAEAALPAYETVAERVAADAQQAARKQANETFYEALRARYDITVPADRLPSPAAADA